jgi:hypothetical protein
VKTAIKLFNQTFNCSLNPQDSYMPAEIDALIEVARSRGRPDIAGRIAEIAGKTGAGSPDIPEDRPSAS